MDTTSSLARAFGIGVITGLRSMTAPTAVSWAAHRQGLDLQDTPLAFLGAAPAPYLFTALALAELVGDKLPKTPSRKAPGPFAARVALGALSGAALCAAAKQSSAAGALLGGLGAVAGALGGYEARTRLVKALNAPDLEIALLEDAVAIGGGAFLVSRFC
jgi:uncharacterized membrane protein